MSCIIFVIFAYRTSSRFLPITSVKEIDSAGMLSFFSILLAPVFETLWTSMIRHTTYSLLFLNCKRKKRRSQCDSPLLEFIVIIAEFLVAAGSLELALLDLLGLGYYFS